MKKNQQPKIKESSIVSAVSSYLQYLENQSKLVFVRNNSGAFVSPTKHFFRFGKAGSPDFFIFLKSGSCLHLEIKNKTGRQNPHQIEYQKKIEKLGHYYCIARDLDEVEALIKSFL